MPVLLDAAQAIGAVPVDVHALGCAFYAGSGQKWLCGPEGSGCLYVREDRLDELLVPWPGYGSLADARERARVRAGRGRRAASTTASRPGCAARGRWLRSACSRRPAGTGSTSARPRWPPTLADRLAERGLEVGPRGRSTLVSWKVEDSDAEVARLAGEGVVVRSIPAHGLVRASVGAWTSEEELERLVELAA